MISFRELFLVFGRIGLLSFGGPAAQIAVMHRELVDTRPWLTEQQFLNALSFCMLLPGPEAMQLATYSGWRLRGVTGGLIAGALFVLPGALVIGILALLYVTYGTQPATEAALLGVKATVIVIVLQALLKLSRKALTGPGALAIAALGFAGIFALHIPFPVLIALAALWGYASRAKADTAPPPWPRNGTSLQTIAIWAGLWALPPVILWAMDQDALMRMALFFARLAVVTFGGAYAVLAYMTQEVVTVLGWLTTEQMVDALGLAETTPGPLILVTQFVGMVAGHGWGGAGLAILAGLITLWMTFVPCFLWIFTGAPYIEHILGRPRLQGALQAITAIVVGVILNLSVWFALHVVFADVHLWQAGIVQLPRPDLATLRPEALALTLLAALLMFGMRRGPVLTLCATAIGGLLLAAL